METGRDILEIFFEALSTPKNSIVTELLSNGFDNDPSEMVK